MLAMGYNWAGDTIIRDTVMWDRRAVLGYSSIYIPTDIRAWLNCAKSSRKLKTVPVRISTPNARSAFAALIMRRRVLIISASVVPRCSCERS